MLRHIARFLRQLAAKLDPPTVTAAGLLASARREQTASATALRDVRRMFDELALREALDRSLNRYSPKRLPAQA